MENLIKMDDLGGKPLFLETPPSFFLEAPILPSLKLTELRKQPIPKGKACIPTINFQGLLLLVSGRISFRISIVYLTVP